MEYVRAKTYLHVYVHGSNANNFKVIVTSLKNLEEKALFVIRISGTRGMIVYSRAELGNDCPKG